MKRLSLCAAVLVANTSAIASWHDACRDVVFKERGQPWDVSPKVGSANQKPWLPFCDGYLEGLFDAMAALHVICVPEGTRRFQIGGAVVVWYNKATEQDKSIPALVAFDAWTDAFPCSDKKKP
jgi:Rap1a immunity proteins